LFIELLLESDVSLDPISDCWVIFRPKVEESAAIIRHLARQCSTCKTDSWSYWQAVHISSATEAAPRSTVWVVVMVSVKTHMTWFFCLCVCVCVSWMHQDKSWRAGVFLGQFNHVPASKKPQGSWSKQGRRAERHTHTRKQASKNQMANPSQGDARAVNWSFPMNPSQLPPKSPAFPSFGSGPVLESNNAAGRSGSIMSIRGGVHKRTPSAGYLSQVVFHILNFPSHFQLNIFFYMNSGYCPCSGISALLENIVTYMGSLQRCEAPFGYLQASES
jgi:hypothetical protein